MTGLECLSSHDEIAGRSAYTVDALAETIIGLYKAELIR